jgi:hypothetical protein
VHIATLDGGGGGGGGGGSSGPVTEGGRRLAGAAAIGGGEERPPHAVTAAACPGSAHGLREKGITGAARLEIREARLYRQQGHATFEEYCSKRWGWTRNRGDRMVQAAEVLNAIMPSGIIPPRNEAQARELPPLPDPAAALAPRLAPPAPWRRDGQRVACVIPQ